MPVLAETVRKPSFSKYSLTSWRMSCSSSTMRIFLLAGLGIVGGVSLRGRKHCVKTGREEKRGPILLTGPAALT